MATFLVAGNISLCGMEPDPTQGFLQATRESTRTVSYNYLKEIMESHLGMAVGPSRWIDHLLRQEEYHFCYRFSIGLSLGISFALIDMILGLMGSTGGGLIIISVASDSLLRCLLWFMRFLWLIGMVVAEPEAFPFSVSLVILVATCALFTFVYHIRRMLFYIPPPDHEKTEFELTRWSSELLNR